LPKRRAGHAVPECGFAAAACDNDGPSVVARRQSAPNGEARVSEASIPDRLAAAPPARREHVPLAILYMVGATLVFAASSAASKWLVATYPIATLTLYQLTLLTGLFALFLPFGWITPTAADAGLIVFNGVANAVGQYWWTRALHLAPASAVTPFFYLSLVWASILGFAVWGEVPTMSLVIGSAVVVASGLFLLWREAVARQAVGESARE
jgi:drug/metabolite transporter (DMT)-like permease